MARRSGVRRAADGGVRVTLTSRERDLLRSLAPQLRPILAGEQDLDTAGGWVRERLFPSAYSDPLDEMEYRELIGDGLARERLAALDAFAATLDGGAEGRLTWSTSLDADQAHAWLSATNDARLTLAMVLGVTDESEWERRPDPEDATTVVLHYLGWLQEQLLAALSGQLR